jgi:1-phosphofructokinase
MFTTVTLNPCVDRTAWISGFQYGEFNAVTKTNIDVSGKGINVSVALAQLGVPTHCVYFNYRNDEKVVPRFLEQKAIPGTALAVDGSLRMNVKLFDEATRVMTECNEKGFPVTEADVARAFDAIVAQIDRSTAVVLTGSVPPGVPDDFYAQLIREVKRRGKVAILDADKALLREGITACPDYVKPNRSELQRLTGRELNTLGEIVGAAKELVAGGIGHVCVSMGADGAILCSEEGVVYSKGASIDVKGVQGAGDSLVAGMCMAIQDGLGLADTLRYAVAVANGSLVLEGTQMCTKENFDFMLPRVDVSVMK